MPHVSYAMRWSLGADPRSAGRVELGDGAMTLVATTPAPRSDRISFDEIAHVTVDRKRLRIERMDAATVELESLDAPGALRELADRLTGAID